MKSQTLIYIVCAIIAVIAIYFITKKTLIESFQINLGMLHPQNKFYAKCTDNCFRKDATNSGDSSPGQFKWLCTDACQEKANNRILAGIPDLTDFEYERHNAPNSCYSSTEPDRCFCYKERKEAAKQFCTFSKLPFDYCIESYMRTRAVNCETLTGGGMFI